MTQPTLFPAVSGETRAYRDPGFSESPRGVMRAGAYRLRFASSSADVEAVQRLRFEVFNLELGEGLQEAYLTGRDEDRYDASCHHLLVESAQDGTVVGTYRLMSAAMARESGFYSESEFDFGTLDRVVLDRAVEVGRACVAREHRTGRVVHLLWRGLLRYLVWNDKQYLFGCCSVPTLDPAVGHRVARDLAERGAWHPTMRAEPLPALVAPPAPPAETAEAIPPLFESYLGLGAIVLGGPAIDRDFRVTDFLVLLDLAKVDPRVRRAFERAEWTETGEA